MFELNSWALEGQASYPQKIYRETGKLRRIEKITPPNLMFSSRRSLCLHALDFLLTFSSMEKVRAMRLEQNIIKLKNHCFQIIIDIVTHYIPYRTIDFWYHATEQSMTHLIVQNIDFLIELQSSIKIENILCIKSSSLSQSLYTSLKCELDGVTPTEYQTNL